MRKVRKYYEPYRVVTKTGGESATDTSFGNDTNINRIIARFKRDGESIKPPEPGTLNYEDVTGLQGDLTETIQRAKDAQIELEKLQAKANQEAAAEAAADKKLFQELKAEKAKAAAQAASSPANEDS